MSAPPPAWLLVLITGLGPFSLQIIVPAIPGLAASFAVPQAKAQLSLTVYLLGVALGQLLYGPLSDRYGRRPMAIAGLVVFLAASTFGTLAASMPGLIAARALQALGACAGMVLARAMIRDCYPRDRSASIMAYVFMGMTVAPMIAPVIGALLDDAFGWRALFVVPGLLGLAVFVAVLARLPETLRREGGAAHGSFGEVVTASLGLLRSSAFGLYAGCFATSSAVFFAFLGGAPFVVVRGLGLPATAYGIAFAVISVCYAAGNFITARLAVRLGVRTLLAAGTAATFVAAAAALGLALALPPSMANLFGPAMLMAFGNGIAQANAMAGAVSVRPQAAGAASGLAGAIQMAAGAGATVAVAALESGNGVATAGLMLGAAFACQVILFAGRRVA